MMMASSSRASGVLPSRCSGTAPEKSTVASRSSSNRRRSSSVSSLDDRYSTFSLKSVW